MSAKWVLLLVILALAPACHKQSNMQREQQNYDVVQEGSTSGASSTINAPGETAPPVAGTTTSADSTTNFTLPTSQTSSDQAATVGDILPKPARTEMRSQQRPYYTPSEGRRELRPAPATTTATRPPESDQPPASTTATSSSVEPSSTATTTTSSDTSGETAKPGKKKDEVPPSPPPPTDTTGTLGRNRY